MTTKVICIVSTFNKKKDAKKVCKKLLEKRIVACGQVTAEIQSFYWWDNKIENSFEYTLIVKTFKNMFNIVADEIRKNHPYDTPEIIGTKVDCIDEKYLNWMKEEINN